MRFCVAFFLALLLGIYAKAQTTITASGQCITGTINLTANGTYNGKTVYQGTGTVAGFNNVAVNMYWLGAPDNVWVLDFDGQPYFQNACNSATPFGTGNAGCPWTVVPGTSCTGPNPLVISGGVLAVELSSFHIQKQNKQVILNWQTATEVNNKGFDVQRSKDGIHWVSIGFVAGAGNSSAETNYNYIDKSPLNGLNYYRLLRQDLDGNKTYSAILNIDMAGLDFYSIGNNPVKNRLQLMIHTTEPVSVSLFDLSGKKLLDLQASMGVQQIDVSAFAAGTYLLRLSKGNQTITEKLIKQ